MTAKAAADMLVLLVVALVAARGGEWCGGSSRSGWGSAFGIRRKSFSAATEGGRKFKGEDIVDNASQASNATTIAPGMYKLDSVTLAPKVKNNRETHIYYLKHTMEQLAILREIVEQAKSLNPLDSASYVKVYR
nr:hypothetical protein [Tanacetum cinerariifolium]